MADSDQASTPARDPWAEAMKQVASGNADALATLYDGVSSAVYSLAVRMLGSTADAEEITVDVFRHAWQNASTWDNCRGTVLAWLLMLTRSRCLDRIRTRESRRRAEEPERRRPTVTEPDPTGWQRAERVRSALAQLPPEQRHLIEMAWFDGLSQSELAEVTGAPLGTVKTRIRLGMCRLRNLLKELQT